MCIYIMYIHIYIYIYIHKHIYIYICPEGSGEGCRRCPGLGGDLPGLHRVFFENPTFENSTFENPTEENPTECPPKPHFENSSN